MHTFIDTEDKTTAAGFAKLIGAPAPIRIENLNMADNRLVEGNVYYGSKMFNKVSPSYRLFMAKLAAQGAVLFSNDPNSSESPIYAGGMPEPKFLNSAKLLVSHAVARSEFSKTFGVKFLGHSYDDPRHILVLDNKKSFEDEASTFLNACPPDWWNDLAIVTTSNVEKYREFFEYYCYAIPMAYSPSAKSKLDYVGIDYCSLPEPGTDRNYGVTVRVLANKRSNELYLADKHKD